MLVTTKSKIAVKFEEEKNECIKKKRSVKKEQLNELINEIKTNSNLPEANISGTMICQRIKCCKVFTLTSSGYLSPLLAIEPTIVSTGVQLF